MRVTYMPGGIGAVAYNAIVAQRPAEPNTIVAFSGGSLLNIAQGKFGRYNENDVRWLAVIGADYGAVVVRKDSPFKTMNDLAAALKTDATKVVLGAGGTVGSQDWMKARADRQGRRRESQEHALRGLRGRRRSDRRAAGRPYQRLFRRCRRKASVADQGGLHLRAGGDRSESACPARLADVPTAKEQGYDIDWAIVRGFYMGPKVPATPTSNTWSEAFAKVTKTGEFAASEERGLYPMTLTGAELNSYIKTSTEEVPQAGRRLRPDGTTQMNSDRVLGLLAILMGAAWPPWPGATRPRSNTSRSDRAPSRCCWPR